MTRLDALRQLLANVKARDVILRTDWNVVFHKKSTLDAVTKANNGSLDGAKQLHEAVLPEWEWVLHCGGPAEVFTPDGVLDSFIGANADPARAWLIAILEALIAMEEDKE